MKQFTDTQGRSWTIEINVAALKRVKGLTGVDLMGVLDGDLVQRFIGDPVLLCDVLYAVCKPQADKENITDEDFGRAMAGDTIERATESLLDEIVSFCPNPRDRAALGKVLAATNTAMEKARDLVDTRIDSGALDRAIDEALDAMQTPGDSSTAALASSGSIPPP